MSISARALAHLWAEAGLSGDALSRVHLVNSHPSVPALPSTFDIGALAQATIAASGLAASEVLAIRSGTNGVDVSVDVDDAVAEFRSEQLGTLDGEVGKVWDALAGVYRTNDGYIRPHTNWTHHRVGLLRMLGLPDDADKPALTEEFLKRSAEETAEQAMRRGLPVTSLHSFQDWPPKPFPPLSDSTAPLKGVRVLDLTRVIAGPTAGRTLAAYGADVIWINAPHLPSLPGLDADTSRGKRTVQLDIRPSCPNDRSTFVSLLKEADVLLQAYRPGGLAALGLSTDEVAGINPDIVYATLSAFGEGTPWEHRKGFDSITQFTCGINQAEGEAFAQFEGRSEWQPKPLPCQALDHASGFGIQAALLKRATSGGSYVVSNSLLSTATWFRTFFPRLDPSAFEVPLADSDQVRERGGLETMKGFGGGTLESVTHAAKFGGEAEVGCKFAPAGLNNDKPEWL
ncbi:L-carnitine dehydratase/bile acid-inducible protein F [Pseudohyphozyma bogoriensis]|nr:L-carnitine dehydratase/bile acid-inducible protein F [Pseudohyphozyma bogoriensis]